MSNETTGAPARSEEAIDWELAPDFGRRQTLLRSFRRLAQICPGPACLVEAGTARDETPRGRAGDGWSTIACGWYAAQTGGRVHTVDIDSQALAICRRLTAPYSGNIEYACSDSVTFFRRWVRKKRGAIHFLYLDSVDYHDSERSEEHHLQEAQAALPVLAPKCLVLIDDTRPIGPPNGNGIPPLIGKGARAVPYLADQGFNLEWCMGGQVLLSRGVPRPRDDAGLLDDEFRAIPPARRLVSDHMPPLHHIRQHFANLTSSPHIARYLQKVLGMAEGGHACEIGTETGYPSIWLSQHGLCADGLGEDPHIVEKAKAVNSVLDGSASFQAVSPFDFFKEGAARYQVIHHQGLLEHFQVPWIRSLLAQQVALADWIVFSVPSVYYPFEEEIVDERLLPHEEWRHILEPFDVVELEYYGDPRFGDRDHILGVLRGQAVDDRLHKLMVVPLEIFDFGISAIVHTRNEERHIADCLETLKDWTDEIIVCDMESDDRTLDLARQFTDNIIEHPLIPNFDRARNVSAMRAKYRWVFYLAADERVPPGLGPALRDLIATQNHLRRPSELRTQNRRPAPNGGRGPDHDVPNRRLLGERALTANRRSEHLRALRVEECGRVAIRLDERLVTC